MKYLFFVLALAFSFALIGQSQFPNNGNNPDLKAWCLEMDLHPDQISSMLNTLIGADHENMQEILTAFMNKTTLLRREGAMTSLEESEMLDWSESFDLTIEQVQDLHKVALRFALQGSRR